MSLSRKKIKKIVLWIYDLCILSDVCILCHVSRQLHELFSIRRRQKAEDSPVSVHGLLVFPDLLIETGALPQVLNITGVIFNR